MSNSPMTTRTCSACTSTAGTTASSSSTAALTRTGCHDQLHRELAKTGLQEFELFRMSSRTEYEANAFAAHLLLDNDEVYRLVRAGEDMETISKRLRCNINLMLIKMREMVALGYDLRLTDTADRQFFKKVRA